MSCKQENLAVETLIVPGNINIDMASATAGDNRRLMVSDNPETLTQEILTEPFSTLWHDVVVTTKRSMKHRIFGWHYNRTGAPVRIGITIENKDEDQIEVRHIERDLKRSPSTGHWIIDVGQCLAKSCVGGTLDRIKPVDHYKFGRGVALIEEFTVDDDVLAGFIYEFTVEHASGKGGQNYEIRTVVSKEDHKDLREITSDPLPPRPAPQAHPRGSWTFAETEATTPVYLVGQSANYRTCAGTKLTGELPADLLFTADSSTLPGSMTNRGQFGAIYEVNIPILNETQRDAAVRIRVNPRGGAFAGAALIDGKTYGIPLLRNNTQASTIADITVPPGESSYSFKYMTAGSASTPLGIYVTTLTPEAQ